MLLYHLAWCPHHCTCRSHHPEFEETIIHHGETYGPASQPMLQAIVVALHVEPLLRFTAIFARISPGLVTISNRVKTQDVYGRGAVYGEVQIVRRNPRVIFRESPLQCDPIDVEVVALVRLLWPWEEEPKTPDHHEVTASAYRKICSLTRNRPHPAAKVTDMSFCLSSNTQDCIPGGSQIAHENVPTLARKANGTCGYLSLICIALAKAAILKQVASTYPPHPVPCDTCGRTISAVTRPHSNMW